MTPTLTPKQIAAALNVTNREAWRVMRSAGAAEVYRNGRLTLVLTEESFERWLSDPNYRQATTGEGKRSGAAPIRSRKRAKEPGAANYRISKPGNGSARNWLETPVTRPMKRREIPKAPKRFVPKSTREMVFARDKNCCVYCGSNSDLTIDHVRPEARGGDDTVENLVAACRHCNAVKSNYTPEESGMEIKFRGAL